MSDSKIVKAFAVGNGSPIPYFPSEPGKNSRYWSWGSDNMFPYALALMSRRSTTHRHIINDKADYISGKGFSFDPDVEILRVMTETVNGNGESLRQMINKLAFDKCLFGNAFMEVVTDERNSFVSLFHQDASRCRVMKDDAHIGLHHDWSKHKDAEIQLLPLFPRFEKRDGFLRSMVHYKDYEPMYENYGVPPYIAGLNVSAIAYKTDRWNISRLDNSFQLSGIMMLDGTVDNEQDAEELVKTARKKFAGKPGQVMFVMKEGSENDNSKFVPIGSSNEGDWKELHDQATSDIVIAHSWFHSLSGLDYQTGFNSERILHEYEIALNTVIISEQEELLEPIRSVINYVSGKDASSLTVINRPPARSKPTYMKVWEARKADGLDYDEEDENQQLFLSQIYNYSINKIGE